MAKKSTQNVPAKPSGPPVARPLPGKLTWLPPQREEGRWCWSDSCGDYKVSRAKSASGLTHLAAFGEELLGSGCETPEDAMLMAEKHFLTHRIIWTGPREEISQFLTRHYWTSRCGRYRIARELEGGIVSFVALHGHNNHFVEFTELEGDGKYGNHPKRFKCLESAIQASENYHSKAHKQDSVQSNRDDILTAAMVAGLSERAEEPKQRRTRQVTQTTPTPPESAKTSPERSQTPSQRPPAPEKSPAPEKAKVAGKWQKGSGSNKNKVFLVWKKDPETSLDDLQAVTDGAIKTSTLKAWLSGWKRGKDHPII